MVKNFIGGQKERTTDAINVNYGRDFEYKILADIVEARDGSLCAKCKKGKLRMKKGFEWGHCFKIDHFYTKPQKGYFTDKDGKEKLLWMGSYGIGIGRTLACIVETHHDERGIVWPCAVAPFLVHLLAINIEEEEVREKAEELYQRLTEAGVEVLYDDRIDVSAGEKFADADLIGIPLRIVISRQTLAKKSVELKRRDKEEKKLVKLSSVLSKLQQELSS